MISTYSIDSHDLISYIPNGLFTGTEVIILLSQTQGSILEEYGWGLLLHTETKRNKTHI